MMRFASALLVASAEVSAAALDTNVAIVGRHVSLPDGRVHFDHPGVRIHAKFTGTSWASVKLSQHGNMPNFFVTYVDGQRTGGGNSSFNTTAWIGGGVFNVTLFEGLDASVPHEVTILKSTEAQWNTLNISANFVTLHGFDGAIGMQLLPVQLPSRRVEFLGDSITAGFCNLATPAASSALVGLDGTAALAAGAASESVVGGPEGVVLESYADSWANLVCDQLGASCHTAAWSGYGMAENCCGGSTLMSDIWRRTLATVGSGNESDPHGTTAANEWNFSSWVPHAVVINLGTNDALDRRPTLVPVYNETYLSVLLAADAAYGGAASFFLACGPMSTAYCEAIGWVAQQAAAHGVKAFVLDEPVPPSVGDKCCGHPCKKDDDVTIAKVTTRFIRQHMGW